MKTTFALIKFKKTATANLLARFACRKVGDVASGAQLSDNKLFGFTDSLVKRLQSDNRHKTASIYATAKRSLSQFRNGQDIGFTSLTGEIIASYEMYLKTKGLTKNTRSCYMRALRSIYNQAVKLELAPQQHPFTNVYTGIDKTVKRAADESDIIRLKQLDLSGRKSLELARDLFLFSFYMRGISFIDMANLRKNSVRNGYITYLHSKTKQSVSVRIERCIEVIISRYETQTIDNRLLPIFTTANMNYNSLLRIYNKRLKRISDLMELEQPLSSYVARHTWATIAHRKGIPIEIISECLGHDSENTTRIYIASLGQAVLDKVNAEIIKLK